MMDKTDQPTKLKCQKSIEGKRCKTEDFVCKKREDEWNSMLKRNYTAKIEMVYELLRSGLSRSVAFRIFNIEIDDPEQERIR